MAICLSSEEISRPRCCPRWPGLFLIRLARLPFRLKPSPYVGVLVLIAGSFCALLTVLVCFLHQALGPWPQRLRATHQAAQHTGHWPDSTRLAQRDSWPQF